MKKLFALMTVVIILFLAGCGSQESQAAKPRDLPEGDYSEMGEGVVYVATPGGTSENGNIPVLYLEENTLLTQVGLEAWDFNGNALSYVYIDGMLVAKEQLANTQTSLTLEGNSLCVGVHKVEVVQYTNDDPASEMITYKSMEYEVKPK